MGELAQLVLMNHPALTKLMDRIVSRGWVHRAADAADSRKVLVFITDAGLELAVRLRQRVAEYHDAIDTGDRRAQQLKRLLGTLIRGHEALRRPEGRRRARMPATRMTRARSCNPADRDRRRDRGVLRLRPGAVSQPGVFQVEASRDHHVLSHAPVADGTRLLRGLRCGDRAVPAGCDDHDPGGRGHLRPALGHAHRVICLQHRSNPCVPGFPVPVPRCRTQKARRPAARDQRRGGARGRVLLVHAAARSGVSVLRDQPRDGVDADQDPHLLLGQPDRHAPGHPRVRERGHPACADRIPPGHPVPVPADLLCAPRHLPADRQEDHRLDQGAQGLREVDEADTLRPQPGSDRCGLCGARGRLHRSGGQGEGDAHREAQDGWRVPEHRLRAVEGADPLGQAAFAHPARSQLWHSCGTGRVRLCRGHGTCAQGHPHHRTARFGGALHRARRGGDPRRSEDHIALDRGGAHRRAVPHPDDAIDRHRSGWAACSCRRFPASRKSAT